MLGSQSDEEDIYVDVWQDALIFDIRRRMGYKQRISNQTVGLYPDARYGCNAVLGKVHMKFHSHKISTLTSFSP